SMLVIVPDGPLYGLPFGGLYDRGKARYLLEDHAILLTPSVSYALTGLGRPAAPPPERALVVGAPAIRMEQYPDLAPLPDAEPEAREVAALYPQAELLVGSQATRERFLQSVARHDVTHFGGHAVASLEDPGL